MSITHIHASQRQPSHQLFQASSAAVTVTSAQLAQICAVSSPAARSKASHRKHWLAHAYAQAVQLRHGSRRFEFLVVNAAYKYDME